MCWKGRGQKTLKGIKSGIGYFFWHGVINGQDSKRGFQLWQFIRYDIPDDACIYSFVVVTQNTAELANGMKIDITRHGGIELMAKFPGRFRNALQTPLDGINRHPVTGK